MTLKYYLLVFGFGIVAHGAPLAKSHYYLHEQGEKEIGYSQAVRVGDTLYISGSVGAGDMPKAIHQAYDTLKKTLASQGLDFSHVVKENVYTTNLDDFIAHKDIRKSYFGDDFPAATWVQVQRLYHPSHVLEVELIAVYPKS